MRFLDLTLPTPAENLACDEALLDFCEAGQGDEILRFWEPQEYFVVVGYANRVAAEVRREACAAKNIPILRRCSGGGTVVQGPGCLNYSLILKIVEGGPLGGIASANRFIMERNRAALEALLKSNITTPDSKIEVRGHTDLAVGGRKCSGNAQRRKRRFLLFHGCLLIHFDLRLIDILLPLPSKQPEYRQNRAHPEFLTNLAAHPDSVKRGLRDAWRAFETSGDFPRDKIASLARGKYATDEWNQRF